MKSTGSSAIILALIMLLLVLGAAFVFLFQGRQTLLEQRDVLNANVSDLQSELDDNSIAFQAAEGTRIAIEGALATAQADAVLLEGQLVESQQQVDILTDERDELSASLEAANSTRSALEGELTEVILQPPEVKIIAPETGTAVDLESPVEIVFVATDPVGITAVNLLVDGESVKTYEPEDATLFTVSETWMAEESGPVEFGVLAVNSNGLASDTATINILVTPQALESRSSPGRSDPNAELRAEIENNVVDIRGLTPLESVTTMLLTRDELNQRVESDILAEYTEEDAQIEYLTLFAFDLLPANFELYNFKHDLYSEQIDGFYDQETNELVVVSEDEHLNANEQLTHAHEYMHALQDQYHDLDLLLDDEDLDNDADQALLALVEGEAMLVRWLYNNDGLIDNHDSPPSLDNVAETPVLENAPPIIADSLLFPYTSGLEFTQTLFEQDGFDAIDAAWNNLPQSTEQILHPERYFADDTPQLVSLPPLTDTLGTEWSFVDENVFGEFMLREYLSQQLTPGQVNTAATGWGGDRYALYTNDDEEVVLVLQLIWDTDEDATEFAALYPNYPSALFETDSQLQGNGGECWQGPEDVICLFQNGRRTTVIRAPDLATAVDITTQLNG